MLFRQKPRDESGYYKVLDKTNIFLQKQGLKPKYYDGQFWYYRKSQTILELLKDRGDVNE